MPRRSRRYLEPRPRAGSVLQATGRTRRRRRARRPGRGSPAADARVLAGVVLLAAVVGGVVLWQARDAGVRDRAAAARHFAAAWAAGDRPAMWRALTPRARAAHPEAAFAAAYARSDRAAGVLDVAVGRTRSGRVLAAVTTDDFGILRGQVDLPVSGKGASAGVDWDPSLRLPGLRRGEDVVRRAGPAPGRAGILAADGTRLDATGPGAAIAGTADGPRPTGLERLYDRRLAGHASERLLFGSRVVARAPPVHGRTVRTTLSPRLMRAAADALGNRLGGVAVLRPRDGAILALSGLAVSAPQPPGSTFKIITAAAALDAGIAHASSVYPVARYATLSGVRLKNASSEACGGSLIESFTQSCNSVFGPLGARLGAARLVAAARAFGFDEQPKTIPAAQASTISAPAALRDDLAVGAAAIGQDRDLATPLEMASVGATIAAGGRRARPRIATLEPIHRTRAIPTGSPTKSGH